MLLKKARSRQSDSSHRRVPSRPMTRRQERLFLCVVFALGVLLEAATVLNLLPLTS
jgi:hypothetical protein